LTENKERKSDNNKLVERDKNEDTFLEGKPDMERN